MTPTRAGAATILVVEDEDLVRMVLCEALEDAGYATEEAADGLEAFDKARQINPDLIVTDIHMPGSDGLELITKLRQGGLQTPIVAISGDVERYDIFGIARRLGASATLQKPFDPEALLALVADCLPRSA